MQDVNSCRDERSHIFHLISRYSGMGVSVGLAHLINMHNNIMFMHFTVLRCERTGSWRVEGTESRGVRNALRLRLRPLLVGCTLQVNTRHLFAGLDNPLKHNGNYVDHQMWYSKNCAFLYCVCACVSCVC